jgi:hypothetical protein
LNPIRDNMTVSTRQRLDLSAFDAKLLNGFVFCRKVYDLFDQVRNETDGVANLRLRPTKVEKRLIEELIPIARYVQARYREGRRIKVRWYSGSQPYDAIIWSTGAQVERQTYLRKLFIEVTTSVHRNEHLARRLLHERGGSFGVKSIARDKNSGDIISRPCVYDGSEVATDLAVQILERLESKASKNYSPTTVLIVNCIPNTLILDSDWNDTIALVTKGQAHLGFHEVFLLDTIGCHSTTLYGNRDAGPSRRTRDHSWSEDLET